MAGDNPVLALLRGHHQQRGQHLAAGADTLLQFCQISGAVKIFGIPNQIPVGEHHDVLPGVRIGHLGLRKGAADGLGQVKL